MGRNNPCAFCKNRHLKNGALPRFSKFKVQIMCAPNGALLYLLDCFTPFAMTKELETLSLRASVSDAWQSSELVLRVAHKHCSLLSLSRRSVSEDGCALLSK